MSERAAHKEHNLDPLELVRTSISWLEAKTDETRHELKAVKAWPASVRSHGGAIFRKEREIYYLDMRLSDFRHLYKVLIEMEGKLADQRDSGSVDPTTTDSAPAE